MGRQTFQAPLTTLARYRADLTSKRVLTAEQEQALAIRYRDGDEGAGRELVEACLPFVISIAVEYRRWGVPLEDIVQEGNIGLLKAAIRFDPDKGCRLVTYAAYWIRAEIRDYVVRSYRIVRVGASKTERRALRYFRRTGERDASLIAAESGLSVERAQALLPLLTARDVSLDVPVEGGASPVDGMSDQRPTPEDLTVESDHAARLNSALRQAVDALPERERLIVRCRWLTDAPKTLEELGAHFGISKERVRQLEERAKKRMRASLEPLVEPRHAA